MGRSVTDLEGKGTVCHGLYCDMSSSTGRDIYPVPSWIQKNILGPALFSKTTVLVGQKQMPN